MKVIAAILIIAGLIIGAYPIADEIYTRYLEYKMMDAYIESLTQEVVSPDISDGFEQLQLVFEEEREIMVTSNQTRARLQTCSMKVLIRMRLQPVNLRQSSI